MEKEPDHHDPGLILPSGFSDPTSLASEIHNIVSEFFWVADCYIINFYTQNLWSRIPQTWQVFLESLDPQQIYHLPTILELPDTCPSDLAGLIIQSRRLSLPRDPSVLASNSIYAQQEQIDVDYMKFQVSGMTTEQEGVTQARGTKRTSSGDKKQPARSNPLHDSDLEHFLRLFMSGKKQHEVVRMGYSVKAAAEKTGVKTLLDIGSGEGYLSRVLSWRYAFNVVAIDGSIEFTEGAEKRTKKVERAYEYQSDRSESSSTAPSVRNGKLFHLAGFLDPSMDPKQFDQFIQPVLDHTQPIHLEPSDFERFGIIGLHCCGDLTPTMMRMFLASDHAKCFSCVSCCYFRMQPTKGNDSEFLNFPMSSYLRSLGAKTTWEALRVGCESAGQWNAQTFQEYENVLVDSWRRFYFDGLLKSENRKRFNCNCAYSLRRFNSKADTISNYVKKAIPKLKIQENPSPGAVATCQHLQNREKHLEFALSLSLEDLDEQERNNQLELKRIGAFYALRISIGSLIESLVLLDRYLFLKEQPNVEDVKLLPIFKEAHSPRNMVLIATKKNLETDIS